MSEQHVLYLSRIDVLAAADDHVLDPALDAQAAIGVHGGQITGVVPAIGVDRLGRELRGVMVTAHDQVTACAKLADLAGDDRLASCDISNLHFSVRERRAEGLSPLLGGCI